MNRKLVLFFIALVRVFFLPPSEVRCLPLFFILYAFLYCTHQTTMPPSAKIGRPAIASEMTAKWRTTKLTVEHTRGDISKFNEASYTKCMPQYCLEQYNKAKPYGACG